MIHIFHNLMPWHVLPLHRALNWKVIIHRWHWNTSHYRFLKSSIIAELLCYSALSSGVKPHIFSGFLSSTFSMIRRHNSRCPFSAALCKGVSPYSSSGFLSWRLSMMRRQNYHDDLDIWFLWFRYILLKYD